MLTLISRGVSFIRIPNRVSPSFVRTMSKLSEFAGLQDGHGLPVRVVYQSNVAIITMDRGENRMNDEFIDNMNAAIDEALSNPDIRGIITTGRGKFYSNGLDLKWLLEIMHAVPDHMPTFLAKWHGLQKRILSLPVPTVAAINGHAYAGGGVMSMCHDYRVMQMERGYWCLNEVHLGLNFPKWIIQLLRIKLGGLGARSLLEAAVFGKRYTAEEAQESGVVDDACLADELIPKALFLIDSLVSADDSLSRDFINTTKTNIFEEILKAGSDETALPNSRL